MLARFPYITYFLELFCHEVALACMREVLQLAKDAIAILSVELWRLEAERVQIGIQGSPLPRFLFSQRQEAMAMAATTKLVFYPQQVYMEPIPVSCADYTAYNHLVGRMEDETQVFMMIIACLLSVVGPNAFSNRSPFGISRFVNVNDLVSLIHIHRFAPFRTVQIHGVMEAMGTIATTILLSLRQRADD